MPEFSETIEDKIIELRGLQRLGISIQVYHLVKVLWPSGTVWYGVMPVEEVADPAPYDDNGPIKVEARIIATNNPNWFLPVEIDATIGDSEVDLEFWDADEVFSNLLVTNGEGVNCQIHWWFPQVELLLRDWDGHLKNEDEASEDSVKLKAVQGIRSSDYNVPSRAHYQNCMAIFGGLLATQDLIDAHDCPYNKHIGGSIGTLDPTTGLPWTFCNRQDIQSCIARGVNPLFHLSHRTIVSTTLNPQHGGPALLITSEQNETNLKDPVCVAMGRIRNTSMLPVAFSVPSIQENGWYFAIYEGCEGPIGGFSQGHVTVSGRTVDVAGDNLIHYWYVLGNKGQPLVATDISHHGYSGTALVRYNFGWIDTRGGVNPTPQASASFIIDGLNNIRIYTDADTFTTSGTSNRAWQLARALCDNRWGFGYDYDRLDIATWIDAAQWSDTHVTFTDPFGDNWTHIRGESHVLLTGKKVQQQIEDMCMAGRLSRPFLFNGKIQIVPLRALTSDELAACPVFSDTGEEPNIIRDENGKSSLTISRISDYDLTNRVECTFNDAGNDWLETPLNPIEDVDAQLAAGAVEGDGTRKVRKVNSKKYPLQGVTNKSQALKVGWSLLDLGPHDEGGLKNNCSPKFKTWFSFTLDLHIDKVIKIDSARLTKYGFSYFRIKKMKRNDDLTVEIECQAYNVAYMNAFEAETGTFNGPVLTVTDAGDEGVWGIYYYDGTFGGRTKWNDDPFFIQNNGTHWELRQIETDPTINILFYRTTDNPANPWDANWTNLGCVGLFPPPTVTQGHNPMPIPDRPEFEPVRYENGVLTIG